eukprot:6869757-Heterocapsa_arctica.AAC.1
MNQSWHDRTNTHQHLGNELRHLRSKGQETHSLTALIKTKDDYSGFTQADRDRKGKNQQFPIPGVSEKNQHFPTPGFFGKEFEHNKDDSSGSRGSKNNSVNRDSQHRSHGRRLFHRQCDEHHERAGIYE